jgi:hypothetical protein
MESEQKYLEERIPKTELDAIKIIVEGELDISIFGDSRKRPLVDARIIYAKIAREYNHSYKSIGENIGKDHATIIHYMKNFDWLFSSNTEFRETYIYLKEKFREIKPKLKDIQEIKIINNSMMLHKQIESLSLENEKYLSEKLKYDRLQRILWVINDRTPIGQEEYVESKLHNFFNSLVMR